jgi:hypothetical protein
MTAAPAHASSTAAATCRQSGPSTFCQARSAFSACPLDVQLAASSTGSVSRSAQSFTNLAAALSVSPSVPSFSVEVAALSMSSSLSLSLAAAGLRENARRRLRVTLVTRDMSAGDVYSALSHTCAACSSACQSVALWRVLCKRCRHIQIQLCSQEEASNSSFYCARCQGDKQTEDCGRAMSPCCTPQPHLRGATASAAERRREKKVGRGVS